MVRGEGLELVIQQVLARRNETAESAGSSGEDDSTRTPPDGQSEPPDPEPDPIQDDDVWDIVRDEFQPSQSDSNTQTVSEQNIRDRDSGISDTSLTENHASLSETNFHIGSQSETERGESEGPSVM